MFFKETDTHALLHRDSYHPKHTFPGVVKSKLLQFHRICTQHSDFLAAKQTLYQVLTQRGYPRSLLCQVSRTFLEVTQREDTLSIPLETTFGRRTRLLNSRLKQNLVQHLRGSGTLEGATLISAYRKNCSVGESRVGVSLLFKRERARARRLLIRRSAGLRGTPPPCSGSSGATGGPVQWPRLYKASSRCRLVRGSDRIGSACCPGGA